MRRCRRETLFVKRGLRNARRMPGNVLCSVASVAILGSGQPGGYIDRYARTDR